MEVLGMQLSKGAHMQVVAQNSVIIPPRDLMVDVIPHPS
jgi:hypothetical protein